ncbi:hypothetical protein QO010_003699 [Caulobacter ginsengisoli]|uniref:Uncharacterized protein n=1 Tax=Caulobacter ginsengisoli TaxID=400775 RepID=A0ABU0IV69_9CAUL|nr:hypothetical protein [Caulobacter ginsengisoli]
MKPRPNTYAPMPTALDRQVESKGYAAWEGGRV